MAERISTQEVHAESVPHNNGRLVGERSGEFGVSDARRAELSRLEQEAGVQHDATDESVPSRPSRDPERATGRDVEPDAPRPGDKH